MLMKIGILSLASISATAAADTLEFRGLPATKIQLSGADASTSLLDKQDSAKLALEITRDGDRYFWKSRGNVPMLRVEGGAFITYIAATGAGYVRIINPQLKKDLCAPGKEALDCRFDYVEHLVTMMASVTYYGGSAR